jgi:hypothetical protein
MKLGAYGSRVRQLQSALNATGATLQVDGRLGPKTLAAAHAFVQTRTADAIPDWLVSAIVAEAEALPSEGDRPGPGSPAPPRGISMVGAWAGSASLANPERDVAFCVAHNIRRLDIVVNDHSRSRGETRFALRSTVRIRALVHAAREAGITPHLMSWVMPHASYIDAAAAALVPLCNELGVASLCWDAEEPWTRATRGMPRAAAARHLAGAFEDLRCPMGVTGIGYVSADRLGPLAAVCDYVVPQAYATSSSGQAPELAPKKFFERWRDLFARPVVLGLAAYRQSGIAGHTSASAVRAAATAAAATGVDAVIYWSLPAIRRSPSIAAVIREIARLTP